MKDKKAREHEEKIKEREENNRTKVKEELAREHEDKIKEMEQFLIKRKEELAREHEEKIKETEDNKRTEEILENLSKEPAQENMELLANRTVPQNARQDPTIEDFLKAMEGLTLS